MLMLVLLFDAQLSAAEPSSCLNSGAQAEERLSCAQADFNISDSELEQVYAATLSKYQTDERIRQQLQNSHASFWQWREKDCAVKSTGPENQKLYQAMKLECMARHNKLEIQALQEDKPLP